MKIKHPDASCLNLCVFITQKQSKLKNEHTQEDAHTLRQDNIKLMKPSIDYFLSIYMHKQDSKHSDTL